MAAFVFFDQFGEDLAEKVHNLGSDTLECYLSNATPSASADAVKADLAEITNQNGYTAPVDTQNSVSRTGATTSVVGVDFTVTATGTVGPFRYVVLQNTTPTSPLDPLIGYWDYGSALTLANTEEFETDFGSSMFTLAGS